MGEVIDNIIVGGRHFDKLFAHGSGIGSVFRRMRQAYFTRHGILRILPVIEFKLVTERATGIGNKVVLNYRLLGGLLGAGIENEEYGTKT